MQVIFITLTVVSLKCYIFWTVAILRIINYSLLVTRMLYGKAVNVYGKARVWQMLI